MADKDEYLQIIEQNYETLTHLTKPNPGDYTEWCVTIIYYMALHYIHAYLAQKRKRHPASHANLTPEMQDPPLKNLYKTYRNLEDDSRDARYNGTKFSVDQIKNGSIRWFNAIQTSVSDWLKIPLSKQHDISILF